MGKRKKSRGGGPPSLPIFHVKKQKLAQETNLTALVALHKYAQAFKLGAPGFREKGQQPFVVTVVLNGAELGTAQHDDKDAAMEKACLITLHLLDPEGKSITANIHWGDEAALKRLCSQIVNAKNDEVKALAESAAAFDAPPEAFSKMPLNFPPIMMYPPPPPIMMPPTVLPEPSPPAAPVSAPLAPVRAPPTSHRPAELPPLEDRLLWPHDTISPEEFRAALPRYKPTVVDAPDHDPSA